MTPNPNTRATAAGSFAMFFAAVQLRLRHPLAAALGAEIGIEATQDALAWGWEHWDDLQRMDNPAGYLYRVGRSRSRRFRRRRSMASGSFWKPRARNSPTTEAEPEDPSCVRSPGPDSIERLDNG